MKFEVVQTVEINTTHVRVLLPLPYDDAFCMAKDFPLRAGNLWRATIDLETGKILEWPIDIAPGFFEVNEKVVDTGSYDLLEIVDGVEKVLASLSDYVPNGVVPGSFGDYVELEIQDGHVTNMPKRLDVSAFFPRPE